MTNIVWFVSGLLVATLMFVSVAKIRGADAAPNITNRLPAAFDVAEDSSAVKAYEVLSVWYDPENEVLRANLIHTKDWNYELSFWADVSAAIVHRLIYFYHTQSNEMTAEQVYVRLRSDVDEVVSEMIKNKEYPVRGVARSL